MTMTHFFRSNTGWGPVSRWNLSSSLSFGHGFRSGDSPASISMEMGKTCTWHYSCTQYLFFRQYFSIFYCLCTSFCLTQTHFQLLAWHGNDSVCSVLFVAEEPDLNLQPSCSEATVLIATPTVRLTAATTLNVRSSLFFIPTLADIPRENDSFYPQPCTVQLRLHF